MRSLLIGALAATSVCGYQPTQTDLQTSLARAAAAWGQSADTADVRVIRLDYLNPCRSRTDTGALTEFAPRTITINTACRWSRAMLRAAVEHEYGHMLAGDATHSNDRHSVMFWQLGARRKITAADRARVQQAVDARAERPTILRGDVDDVDDDE